MKVLEDDTACGTWCRKEEAEMAVEETTERDKKPQLRHKFLCTRREGS